MTELVLPWPPKELSPNARVHWSVRSKKAKACREIAYWETKRLMAAGAWQNLPAEGKIELHLDFYPPNRRPRDDDNLVASFKAFRDGIADALGIDDKRFKTRHEVMDMVCGMVKVRVQ
jgi:crossover junction endodeoxyribonuclease RusA